MSEYYKSRFYNILNRIEDQPNPSVLKEWDDLLSDMYGDNQANKMDLIKAVLLDEKISPAAKNWLKQLLK